MGVFIRKKLYFLILLLYLQEFHIKVWNIKGIHLKGSLKMFGESGNLKNQSLVKQGNFWQFKWSNVHKIKWWKTKICTELSSQMAHFLKALMTWSVAVFKTSIFCKLQQRYFDLYLRRITKKISWKFFVGTLGLGFFLRH